MPTPSETVALCQAETPAVGADELHTAPSSSAAMHRDAEAHETASSAGEVRCVTVHVVLGAVSVSTLPLSSTAAQKALVGHETEFRLLVPSISSLTQLAAPPDGDAEVNALPSPSTATQ